MARREPRSSRSLLLASALISSVLIYGCVQRDVVAVVVGEVVVSPPEASLVEGDSLRFQATVTDVDGRVLPRVELEWAAETSDHVIVRPDGWVVAANAGQDTVRATYRGATGSAMVNVIASPRISVAPDSVVLRGEVGTSGPPPDTLVVENSGGAQLTGLEVEVIHPPAEPTGWLAADLTGTRAIASLILTASTASLEVGSYEATVRVTSVDDEDPFDVPVRLSLTGLTVTETDGATVVSEGGGTDTVNVVLDAQPDSTVTLGISSGDPAEVSVSPDTLMFGPADWNVPQAVIVTGVNDLVRDGDRIATVSVAVDDDRSDEAFQPIVDRTVDVTNTDDDTGSFSIAETDGGTSVGESGGTDDFTLVLDAQPLDTVVFRVAVSDTTEVASSPATLVFAPSDWDVPQTVVVQGRDDDILDGSQTTFVRMVVDSARSDAAFIAQGLDSLAVTTLDDDEAGFSLTTTDGETLVSESGTTDTVFVALDAEPASEVVLTTTPSDVDEIESTTSPLTFTPADWDVPQAIVVTGGDDRALDGDQVTSVTVAVDDVASDDAFDGLASQSFAVTTVDDDVAGFDIVESDGSTVTDEAGLEPDSFTVSLDAQPGGDVAIDLVSSDESEVVLDPTRLVFTNATWDQPQTVTVSGIDERFDDGDREVPLVLTVDTAASHEDYDLVTPDTVPVTNVDDDTAGFTLTQSEGGTLVTEAGSQDTVTVVLNARPIDDVVITLLSADTTEATVAPTLLTFTTDDWETPQPFIVTGVDDGEADGNRFSVIAVGVSGALSDATFAEVDDQTVQVTTINDDAVSVTVSPTTGLLTDEGGGTASFEIGLGSAPSAEVTVGFSSSAPDEGVPSPTSVTFTPTDWETPRTVTVTGVDDDIDDGDQPYSIQTSLTSTDPDYSAVDPADVSAVNADNEDAPTLSVDDVSVTEGDAGTTDAVFTVTQSIGSTATITVDYATSDGTATAGVDYSSSSGTVTFSPGGPLNQTITVTVSGDAIDEGASETFLLTLSTPSGATIVDGSGTGTIVDDDGAPSLSIGDVTVLEGDDGTVSADFDVALSAASGQIVSVDYATVPGTAVAGADYVASSGTLTFAPGDPLTQTVTVNVNGDLLDEGASEAFSVALTNPVNAVLLDPSGTGTITDDDDAPTLSIDDVTVLEGNTGTVSAIFNVTQSAASGQTVTVAYATTDGTALAGSDYTAASGTLTFSPGGVLTQTVVVIVSGDQLDEGVEETFTLDLTSPTNATLADDSGEGTITDDDDPPSLAINDVTVVEGDAGTVNAQLTVTQSVASGQTVTVDYATADGTATAGSDYVATSNTLTFTPGGPLTQTVTVPVNGDLVDEGASETLAVGLTNAVNATIADGSGTVTITDDDGAPTLSIADLTVTEGDGGTVNADLTVTQSAVSGLTTTVDFATSDGTAVAPDDFVAVSGTLTFPPGSTTQSITVTVNGDLLDEGASESFSVALSNAGNATIADATGVVTISDDDGPPSFSIDDVTVTEGDAGTVDAVFTVSQSAQSGLSTTVDFATADGTATAGADYVAASGTLSFVPGQTTSTVTVAVNGDEIDEGVAETFTLALSNAGNATIADPSGTGTITDDEDPPTLSIADVTVTEGDAGIINAVFTVTQSLASSQTVTVDYASADGSATAGSDYEAATGTLSFLPGASLTQNITVAVNGDLLDEGASETFAVGLSNASNATLADADAVGTIEDDDAPPTLSIDDVTVTEGDSGPVNATFTVTQSAASAQTVSVDYATADGTATVADGDYDADSGTLTFSPGSPLTQTITVIVNGDAIDDPGAAETFTVELSNPANATLGDASGTGTIIDDEGAPSLFLESATVVEGDAATVDADFTVTLSAASSQTITVDYSTADGTATAGADYVATSGTLTFSPGGPLNQTVTVPVNGDLIDEGSAEVFTLNLSNASNATILDGSENGTITDDDAATLAIDDVTVAEGDAGTVDAVFTVTQSTESAQTVSVAFGTADGTATAGSDYVATSGTVTFSPGGSLTQTIAVPVSGDLVDEAASETFSVLLSGPVNATIQDGVGLGTITDDDAAPTLSVDDVAVIEGNTGTTDAVFTVTQSGASSQTVSVDFATAGGTATPGSDFVSTSGTLTFSPGDPLTQTVTVTVNGDVLDEGASESFTLNLSNATSATIADPTGDGTITDDDAAPALSIDDVAVTEGDGGTVNAVFTVTQSAVSGQTVSVDFATADGTATAGSDYVATSGTLTFTAGGALTRTVSVVVTGDVLDEPDIEQFSVVLTNAANATIGDGSGTGSITDDDDPPTLSVGDVTVTEGDAGSINAQFTVTQSASSGLPVSVDYATADGTATTADGDYVATSGSLSFAPGSPPTQTLTVSVNGDLVDEGLSEAFSVELSNASNATIADGSGTGTITDDDAAPVLSIDDVSIGEGDSGTVDAVFTVTLSGASNQTVTVDFASADGTAVAGADYVATSGTLDFLPGGATTQNIPVTINGDLLDEGGSESFTVSLTSPTNATVGDPSGTGTIVDDDGAPTLSVDDVVVAEGDAGTVSATFTVSQSSSSGQTVTVQYVTVDGTATGGSDYVATSGTLSFAPGGSLSQTLTIAVSGDVVDEGASEAFTLELSNPTNATILDGSGTATITDDDDAALSIGDVTLAEGNSGTVTASFPVSLSLASSQTVTVDFATADGTATTADGDYVATTGTLTFSPGGALTQTIDVPVNGDVTQEGSAETFTVQLSNADNAAITDATGLGTIVDDDGLPSLFVDDVTVTEGDAGTVDAVFTVTQSNGSVGTVTVDYATADGTAQAGPDYTAASGSLTFAPGDPLTQTVTIQVDGDDIDEGTAEAFTLNLSNAVNAGILDGSGTGTITDDDTATLTVDDVTVVEGDGGTVNAVFDVTKSLPSAQTVTVDYATADGTATAGSDYGSVDGTLTWAPSDPLTQSVTVVVSGDALDEGAAETFTMELTNAVGVVVDDGSAVGTITDDDDAPTLSVGDVTVTEGDGGTVNAVLTVTQSAPSNQSVSVGFTTVDGSATAGDDYVGTAGTLTLLPGGALTQNVTVPITGDLLDEGASETFTLELSNPVNATISDASGTATILDDDDPPTLSIGDVTVTEGDVGTVNAAFTVSLSGASGQTVSVAYATSDGTASAGSDYTATSGTITFLPGGPLTQNVTVVVSGDLLDEGTSEAFNVTLSGAVNAAIVDGSGVGTILDDDSAPALSIADVTVTEGDAGTVNALFTVTQSAASGQTVSVSYATADGTASAGSDYQGQAGTLTFAPGEPLSQDVTVLVEGDLVDEGSAETFSVGLTSPVNATIVDGTGVGTIVDDDGPPTLSIDDVTVTEGDGGTVNAEFTVTQSAASGLPVSVGFSTADGSATAAGSDYSPTSGSLTFQPGDPLTQTISVAVNGDELDEGTAETFSVNLSSPVNATVADGTGTGTITDDDDPPTLSIADVTVTEGNGGSVNADFTVTLSEGSGLSVGVSFATADGTATLAGSDYAATSGTLTFAPGAPLTQTVSVAVNGDLLDEGASEAFTVVLSGATNATVATGTGTGTISDDDDPPTLSIDDVTVTEGNSGTVNAVFTVTQSAASGLSVSVDYATADGTATVADGDYTATTGTLTIDPGGSLTRTISVPVIGDVVDEGTSEDFTVTLSGATNATLAVPTGTGTIVDDEGPPTIFTNDVTVTEGDAGTVDAVFTVSLSTPSSQTVEVDYATGDGTATAADNDYVATSGTLTFDPGDPLTQTVTVLVNGDEVDEGTSETFTFDLSNAVNATIVDASETGTISDDDDATLSIDDVTVTEGDAGSTTALFTVSKSVQSSQAVSVAYATADGTATTEDGDYVAAAGSLTFLPGASLTQTVAVTVNGDELDEGGSETFSVNLSNVVGATILDGNGAGTITDDDGPPALSIDDVTVLEGDAGTINAVFTVTQSAPSGMDVTVPYSTNDGTATVAGSDYNPTSSTLSFLAGGPLTQTITVVVNGDALDEGASEAFTVDLGTPTNATLADGQGVGTITDDDDPPTMSIADVTVTEGAGGTTTSADFTVTLSAPSGLDVSAAYATGGGDATSGSDYDAASGNVNIAAGSTTGTITVTVNGDALDELDETFDVVLSAPTNATLDDGTGVGTISDDDPTPSLSIDDVTVTEGAGGATTDAVFTVTLSAPSGLDISATYTTGGGDATSGSDYDAASGTVNIAAGSTTGTIAVTVNGDDLDEVDETFGVTLTNPINATILDGAATGTIADDDDPPTLSIADQAVLEGDGASTTSATFDVTLSAPSGQTVTVEYATSGNNATAGTDYLTTTGTLTFDPGETSETITVTVNGDDLDELDETFDVTLSSPSNATIADGTGTGTISDDDPTPSLSIDDVTVTEGADGATTDADFTLTLSAVSGLDVSATYAAGGGDATSGSDYEVASGTVNIAAGSATATITVTVTDDSLDELNETFNVVLSGPTNATLGDDTGVGTISDDDPTPSLSIDDVTVTEGAGGATTGVVFDVTLSAPSGQQVTVDWATANGTAVAPDDYTASSDQLTFLAGETSQTITVTVNGDDVDEGASETFDVELSGATNATISDDTGTATINDDDTAGVTVSAISGDTGEDGTTATFDVVLESEPTADVTIASSSSNTDEGTVTSGASLTFTAGDWDTPQTVTVTGQDDGVDDGDIVYTVETTASSTDLDYEAISVDDVGVTNIDNDAAALSIDDVTATEGDDGTTTGVTFTVTMSVPSTQQVTVDWATANGTAVAPDDYTASSDQLTFLAGETSQTITVTVNGDDVDEGASETFDVELSGATNATISDDTGTATINDDDPS